MSIKTCCYGCDKRAVGCRETCEAWAEHERVREERYAKYQRDINGRYFGQSHAKQININLKTKGRSY